MLRSDFNRAWEFGPQVSIFFSMAGEKPQTVDLPHDAMLRNARNAKEGTATGFFPGGAWRYTKTVNAPQEWRDRRVTLEFEGVYRNAMVYVNDELAGQCPYGYSRFFVPLSPYLKYGEDNFICVQADCGRDSRWYSGAGIYRPVHLLVGGLMHIDPVGPKVHAEINGAGTARVLVSTPIINESVETIRATVSTDILDPSGAKAGTETSRCSLRPGQRATIDQTIYLDHPQYWDLEDPNLYTAHIDLIRDAPGPEDTPRDVIDEADTRFGIRTLGLDPAHGFMLNGNTVKLRGGCIHHDNGILGAATFTAAERRRIQLLKDAGFNAIRSSHNPASIALLDACDELGMLVMDETFDMWQTPKNADDYANDFPRSWRSDVDSMVDKDYNHPSVVMYSTGNEIADIATGTGIETGRLIAQRIHDTDPHRYVTNAINPMIALTTPALVSKMAAMMPAQDDHGQQSDPPADGFNDQLSAEDRMTASMLLPQVGDLIEGTAGALDIVGYNYADVRYEQDHERHPNRIFVGSETYPTRIGDLWRKVLDHPYLIGDFTWTAWDYLGEAGIGQAKYAGAEYQSAGWPWLTGWCGDIDIIGDRRPVSYYRQVVYGLRTAPYAAVQDPQHADKPAKLQAWSWTDAISSWTWDTAPGNPVTVEAYADADEIIYEVNGREAGRALVGAERPCLAVATIGYEPGTLTVIAIKDGHETGRYTLRTHGKPAAIRLDEQTGPGSDIRLISATVVDEQGRPCDQSELKLTATVSGDGTLQGFGTGRPATTESFLDGECTTFHGRALVAVRNGDGECTLTVGGEHLGSASIRL